MLLFVGCDSSSPTAPPPIDCNGVSGGTAVVDCNDICGGPAELDECGVCDYESGNNCVQDCSGEWGGTEIVDECGECGGDDNNNDNYCENDLQVRQEIESINGITLGSSVNWSNGRVDRIYYSEGGITQLPESFGTLSELWLLSLSFSSLSELPESFANLSKLRDLGLDNDEIKALTGK